MSIADIVIIVVIALMALIGVWKGFFKTLISFCGWLVSTLIAVLIAGVVAEALLDIDALGNFVAGSDGVSLFTIFRGMLPDELLALKAGATEAQIQAALGDGVVAALVSPFIGVLRSETIAASALTVGDGIALGMAGGLFEVMVGLALFIVIRIIMTLLVLFLKSLIDKDKKKGALDRLGGFAFGAVRGVMYCVVLLVIVGFLTPFSFMQGVTSEIDKGVIAKPIASVVYNLSGKVTSNENYYNKLIGCTGLRGLAPEEPDNSLAENKAAVKGFCEGALVDNGGLFDKKLFGDETLFDNYVNGLKGTLEAAALKIGAGELDGEKDALAAVAELVKSGSVDTAGNLYKAFYILANDLDRYQTETDNGALVEIENDLWVDFANLNTLLSNENCVRVFGTVGFDVIEAEPDLDRLDAAYTYQAE